MTQRFLQVIGLKPEAREEYLRLHAEVWPEVKAQIKASNIENYSIFLRGDQLISYFEYVGKDYEADMAAMAQDPHTQKWWALTDPCQERTEKAIADQTQWELVPEVWRLD